jgi:holo-[acyl-carrier protein] synthase
MSATGTLRVGMDLVSIDEVAESIRRFGDRYLERVYTPHEIDTSRRRPVAGGSSDVLAAQSLAARFAAKEAVMKVLRPVGVQLDWRSIELHQMTGGWCEIRLSGQAAAMATESGIEELTVSLTHEGTVAGAVVVGRCMNCERGDG